jgi:hypothetical protein
MHLTLKKEATKPAANNFLQQQAKFDQFIQCFNHERPQQAIGMKYPGELYTPSPRPTKGCGISLAESLHREDATPATSGRHARETATDAVGRARLTVFSQGGKSSHLHQSDRNNVHVPHHTPVSVDCNAPQSRQRLPDRSASLPLRMCVLLLIEKRKIDGLGHCLIAGVIGMHVIAAVIGG